MNMTRLLALFCLTCFALLPRLPAAQQVDDIVKISVLPGWSNSDGSRMAALHIALADGWKTYWRAPGDAGIPPQFSWRGSRNLSDVEIEWPSPHQIPQNGMLTIGYPGSVTLPVRLLPSRSNRAVTLAGEVEMGVCKDVCVPVNVRFKTDISAGSGKRDPRIVAALAARPYSAAEAGVTRVACNISLQQDRVSLHAEIRLPAVGGREAVIVETDDPAIWVAQAKSYRKGGVLIAETELYHSEGRAFAVNRSGLRLTVLGRSHAVDIQGCPAG